MFNIEIADIDCYNFDEEFSFSDRNEILDKSPKSKNVKNALIITGLTACLSVTPSVKNISISNTNSENQLVLLEEECEFHKFDSELAEIINVSLNNYFDMNQQYYFHKNGNNTLFELSVLDQGWDGYSADPIPREICDHAKDLLSLLKVEPEIYPTCRETIQFEYDNDDISVEFEIFNNKYEFLVINNVNDDEEMKTYFDIYEAARELNIFNAT